MIRRDISPGDFEHALVHCTSCWFQATNGRWKVLGPDARGEIVCVVVEIYPRLLIVTAFRDDEEDGRR